MRGNITEKNKLTPSPEQLVLLHPNLKQDLQPPSQHMFRLLKAVVSIGLAPASTKNEAAIMAQENPMLRRIRMVESVLLDDIVKLYLRVRRYD